MKRFSGKCRLWLLVCLAVFICPLKGEQDLSAELVQATQRSISALAPNSLRLPTAPELDSPPQEIQSAGKDFVNAWSLWAQIMSGSATLAETQEQKGNPINVCKDGKEFTDLLKRAIEADPPPDLEEFDRFTYNDHSFCADGTMYFEQIRTNAITLILIRQGKHFEALKRLARSADPQVDPLLRAFAVDPEEFRIGGWLNRRLSPEDMCRSGGDKAARMMLDWVELRMARVVEKGGNPTSAGPQHLSSEPYPPKQNLIQFLRPDNGVSDETKARYVKFIETRGLEIIALGDWLNSCPRGSEKWLIPLAKQGLNDELNSVRKRSSYLLKAAGIEHAEPILRPDVRFQVSIDGKPWLGEFVSRSANGSGLGMSIEFEPHSGIAESALIELDSPDFKARDLMTGKADGFVGKGPIKNVSVYGFPSSIQEGGARPSQPWLRANVPLPISFDQINRVNIKTTPFTIRPQLPDRTMPSEDFAYEVSFGLENTAGETYEVRNQMPLVLSRVSPGVYWVTVRYPGAVPSPRASVTISETENLIKPKLEVGSSLVVPVEWPEAKSPDKLPYELSRYFSWSAGNWHDSMRSVLVLKRKDGSVIREVTPALRIAKGRFPDSAIFSCLPPGDYVVESPARIIEPKGGQPGCVISRSSVSVVISKDSPVYVVSDPIKILYKVKM